MHPAAHLRSPPKNVFMHVALHKSLLVHARCDEAGWPSVRAPSMLHNLRLRRGGRPVRGHPIGALPLDTRDPPGPRRWRRLPRRLHHGYSSSVSSIFSAVCWKTL